MNINSIKITTHKALADLIAGKRILLLNSYGKDATLCLSWLSDYACPEHIISLNYRFLVQHPRDEEYLLYLKQRFPAVSFRTQYSPIEISNIMQGLFQCPIDRLRWTQNQTYELFYFDKVNEENRVLYGCDYLALENQGMSRLIEPVFSNETAS